MATMLLNSTKLVRLSIGDTRCTSNEQQIEAALLPHAHLWTNTRAFCLCASSQKRPISAVVVIAFNR